MLNLKLVRGGEGLEGLRQTVHVPSSKARFTIGRDPGCDWCIPDRTLAVSARHCEVVRVDGRAVLRDLSTNGTFVNGARERLPGDHPLRAGDRIVIGAFMIEVSEGPEVTALEPRAALPRRGGDPAAMVGADWERVAIHPAPKSGPADDVKTGLTRISRPPPRQEAARTAAPPAPAEAAPASRATAPAPLQAAPAAAADLPSRLAQALGVPVAALGTNDGAVAAERMAGLLRASVQGLHQQLTIQARQQRQLGSRTALALGSGDMAKLRMARSAEEMLAVLLASATGPALVQQAGQEAAGHTARLLAAFERTTARLGEQLAPQSLQGAVQGAGDAAALWRRYAELWQAMGAPADQPWTRGFGDAAAAHLAAAYDEAAPKA